MAEQLKGAAELQKFLDQLPAKLEANVIRGGLRAGAKVSEKAVKDSINERTGKLRASVKVKTSNRSGVVKAIVSIGDKLAWYARFYEFGTKPHEIKAKGEKSMFIGGLFRRLINHPGATSTRGKMRAALDETQSAAAARVVDYIRDRLRSKHGLEVPDSED